MTRKVFDKDAYLRRIEEMRRPRPAGQELKLLITGQAFAADAFREAKIDALKKAKHELKRAIAKEESDNFWSRPVTQQIIVDVTGGEDEELVGL